MTNPAVSGPAPASDHDGVSSATAIMPRCSAQRKHLRVFSELTSKGSQRSRTGSEVRFASRTGSGSIGTICAENEAHRAPAMRSDFAARDRGERKHAFTQVPPLGFAHQHLVRTEITVIANLPKIGAPSGGPQSQISPTRTAR
jgi:hypothetical protein